MPQKYYLCADTLWLARDLLGKHLFTDFRGQLTGGAIVETEAYLGKQDRACHAHSGRRTARTKVMFRPGGLAYVYLCYGVHALLNIVTNLEEEPHAILIRAIEPLTGLDTMQARRGMQTTSPNLTSGPGKLTQALGIVCHHSGTNLSLGSGIWLEPPPTEPHAPPISSGPRVGIGYAGPDVEQPWRFWISESPWVSKAKGQAPSTLPAGE